MVSVVWVSDGLRQRSQGWRFGQSFESSIMGLLPKFLTSVFIEERIPALCRIRTAITEVSYFGLH